MIQRDFGDRTDRKHARLKYTIDDRGVDWFKGELFKRLGFELPPARPFKFTTQGDRFGWLRGHDGRWHLTLRIESGRVADRPGRHASHRPREDRADSPGRFPPHAQPEPDHRQCAARRVHEDRPAGGGSRARRSRCSPRRCGATRWPAWRCPPAVSPWPRPSATCRTSPSASKALLAQARAAEHSADPAHHRLPEWLRASVSCGDRADRTRARTLHAAPRRRCHRRAAERASIATTSTRTPSSWCWTNCSRVTRAERQPKNASAISCGAYRCSPPGHAHERVRRAVEDVRRCAAPDADAGGIRAGCRRRPRRSTSG